MTFDPSGGTASETDIILSRILPQERFRKPLSVNNLQAQFKTLPCKVKAIYQQHPESQPDSRARAHRRWTDEQWKSVMWSDESTFQIVFGNHGRRVLQAKEEKDHPDCYQLKVQKPTPVMVWRCSARGIMGNVHLCNICCHPYNVRDIPVYFSKTMPSHILHVLQQRGFVVKECRY